LQAEPVHPVQAEPLQGPPPDSLPNGPGPLPPVSPLWPAPPLVRPLFGAGPFCPLVLVALPVPDPEPFSPAPLLPRLSGPTPAWWLGAIAPWRGGPLSVARSALGNTETAISMATTAVTSGVARCSPLSPRTHLVPPLSATADPSRNPFVACPR
jgi:hypothetical protein